MALRLFAGAAAWAFVLLLIGAIALTTLYRRSVLNALDDRLDGVVEALVAAAETDPGGSLALARQPSDPRYAQVFQGRYWQISGAEQGEIVPLLRSRSLWDEVLDLPETLIAEAEAAPGELVSGKAIGPDKEPLRVRVQVVTLPDRGGIVLFAAAEDRRPADRDVNRFALVAGLMFFGFATAIAAGVFLQVRIGLAPVLRMRDRVADVREGRSERVGGAFPVELQTLADELNSLLEHSRDTVERSRTHVGNLAHALKTPIAVLTNESRGRDDPLARLVGKQTDVMSRQVDHHLRRARAAAHAKAIGARADVTAALDDLVRTLRRIYGREGVMLETDIEDGLVFRGESQDLEEMLGNLIDNACKYSNGFVEVKARRVEGGIETVIEDDGPGLDEDACQAVLERGVRLDEQAPGAGLGLAIVVDLARVYGGELALDRSELGGLRVRLLLPAPSR